MPEPQVTVVIPTLAADSALVECIRSLEKQTHRDFEVVIVDNSGKGLAKRGEVARSGARILENDRNAGFGAAINQGFRASQAPYLATLNDDAAAHPGWLTALVSAAERNPNAGLFASHVRLAGEGSLDSAGMLICADGSSKQRGHGQPPEQFGREEEVLLPSASAALYRRALFEELGGFDEDFFLYSEDTDLGLRARWAGWKCLYVPDAVVDHRYSHSAGRASALKAYYVERNRLFLILKNFPAGALLKAPWLALARYAWHLVFLFQSRGSASRFRAEGGSGWKLPFFVLRAHCACVPAFFRLWRKRRLIRKTARITPAEFRSLLRIHAIGPREVAAL